MFRILLALLLSKSCAPQWLLSFGLKSVLRLVKSRARSSQERSRANRGRGRIWWIADSPLGITVEVKAEQNGGTLPVLFSKARSTEPRQSPQVRIWDTWRSLLHPEKYGRIPDHVIVTTGHDPAKRHVRYALICHSDAKLALGAVGFCDLARCRSLKGAGA